MNKEFSKYISESRIAKKSDIQINVPTFNGYEVTKKTLKAIFSQKGVGFDVLLIDNGSDDWKKLAIDFPKMNYVVLNENTGSSGAQRIGGELALDNGYEYVVFTDNDALLLDDFGLLKMKKRLDGDPDHVAAVPKHTESFDKNVRSDFYINSWAFHYLMAKGSALRKVGMHRFDLFLYSDDLNMTLKLNSISRIIVCADVEYFHYLFSPKSLQNKYNYFYLRGLLCIALKERHIRLLDRIRCLSNFCYKVVQMSCNSVAFFDFSYLTTIFRAVKSSIDGMDESGRIKGNRFFLQEVEKDDFERRAVDPVDISKKGIRSFVMPSGCYYWSRFKKKKIFFLRQKA